MTQIPTPTVLLDARRGLTGSYMKFTYDTPITWTSKNDPTDPDGECVCPHRHMHTHKDPDPQNPPRELRIWLDKPTLSNPEAMGKLFFSCRHCSCSDAVWTDTLACRLQEESAHSFLLPPQKPNYEQMEKQNAENAKKIKWADQGKALKEQWLTTPAVSEAELTAMSPYPITKGMHPYTQAITFLSLFPDSACIWIGEPEGSDRRFSVKTAEEYTNRLFQNQCSPITRSEPEKDWVWPGHYIAPCEFVYNAPGRYKDHVLRRLFAVCENDLLTAPAQRQIIANMIKDPRFPVAYVLHSGSKSYHIGLKSEALADTDEAFLAGLSATRAKMTIEPRGKGRPPKRYGGLGFDPASLRISQAVRIPGPLHQKTGKPQRLLYIDPTLGYNI
jgi:hypothetical protein